jgi:hypothetical protein
LQIALVFIFHALLRFVQTLLPEFLCTCVDRTHYESDTLRIIGTGGACLHVGLTLLEFADDGFVVFFAVDVPE